MDKVKVEPVCRNCKKYRKYHFISGPSAYCTIDRKNWDQYEEETNMEILVRMGKENK